MSTVPRSVNVLFSLINSSLEDKLIPSDYSLSMPMYNQGDLNTRIIIRPKISKGMYGSFEFLYNRVPLQDIEETTVIMGSATTLHQLFEQINREPFYFLEYRKDKSSDSFKIPGVLFEEDFTNTPIPPVQLNQSVVMNLKPILNSYLFSGLTTLRVRRIL